jgi:tRNA(Ile)-lysidine synthase
MNKSIVTEEVTMELMDLARVKQLLANADRCTIGVSGGIDSMVLLDWLARHKDTLKTSFDVIHIDHGIHDNSNHWSLFVKNHVEKLGLQCKIVKVSLQGLSNNLEYAARQARYKAFCATGTDTLILAHHANDQCENFLLKLFRGSGVKGLKSMSEITECWYDNKVNIVRPMLSTTRRQIEEYAKEYQVPYVEDPSNQDSKYDRNYIRNKVWPAIEERFDIADINTVRSIQHLTESWELTNILADMDLTAVTQPDGSLDWNKVKNLGYLRIKNMLLRILDNENVYSFSIGHIEQFARGLLDADLDSRNELSLRGFAMQKIGKKIIVKRTDAIAV